MTTAPRLIARLTILENQLRIANERADKAEAELKAIRDSAAKELTAMDAWMDAEGASRAADIVPQSISQPMWESDEAPF